MEPLASPRAPAVERAHRWQRRNPAHFFERAARAQGDVVLTRIGPHRVCLLSHPDHVKDVLVTHNRRFAKARPLLRTGLLLGQGLFTSEGAYHLRQRRLVQPAFHRDAVAGFGTTMIEDAARMAAAWRDGVELDVHRAMMQLTLEIAGHTLFGADVAGDAEEIAAALDLAMDVFRRLAPSLAGEGDALPPASAHELERARAWLDDVIYRLIRERRASGAVRPDVLSMLLAVQDAEGDGEGMTDEQVRDEVLTLLLAGHETSASALAWTWLLLAQHPAAEAALHAELDLVLDGQAPRSADVARLPYTRAVFAEAMRLFPPAWLIGREVVEPVEIGGVALPTGTTVYMSPCVIQRDPRFFAEPDRFRPERWTPEQEAALPRFAYFPFGAGPRKCIGEGFAWTEGILVLATLAQRWRLRLVPEQDVVPEPLITLRPKHGIRMLSERRRPTPAARDHRPPVAATAGHRGCPFGGARAATA